MILHIIDTENKIETAIEIEKIEYNANKDKCYFETRQGKKGQIIAKGKKATLFDCVRTICKGDTYFGEIVWE